MNLIKKKIFISEDSIINFRERQYEHIEYLLNNCLDYLEQFGLEKDKLIINTYDDNNYKSPNHFSLKKIRITVKEEKTNQFFLETDIPKLIHGNFYKLRGVYYVPQLYIIDEPIVLKKNSIKLSSLFKSITIFFDENRVIFCGMNIPVSRFFRIFIDNEDIVRNICDIYDCNYFKEPRINSIRIVSKDLLTFPIEDEEKLPILLNNLFFDEWTRDLYRTYYNLDHPDLEQILVLATHRKKNNVKPLFNDLNYKRIVFIEMILDPLFKAVSIVATELLKGKKISDIKLKKSIIIDHFYASSENSIKKKTKGLCGNTLYNIINGYSGILSLKASFKNPKGSSELPKEVHDVHASHKNRICPITISDSDPGVTVSLIPNQRIDAKFGILK